MGACARPFALKQAREPGLNRAPVVNFFQIYINMLINHQPLEAFLACCTLVNMTAWASTMPVAGPGSAHPGERAGAHFTSPFPVNMVKLTWVSIKNNLVRALTLYTPVRATVSFKCHDA